MSRFAMTPGLFVAGASAPMIASNPVLSPPSPAPRSEEAEANPIENITPVDLHQHVTAPVQEASQPKSHAGKKHKKNKKAPKSARTPVGSPPTDRDVFGHIDANKV
mmetsp:Transcript_31549/g.73849  ORF Transcript_31549/g.73849 Transcript_31549/m.73849 type:complete len:106 (+) Transcript_31549:123-440(+)